MRDLPIFFLSNRRRRSTEVHGPKPHAALALRSAGPPPGLARAKRIAKSAASVKDFRFRLRCAGQWQRGLPQVARRSGFQNTDEGPSVPRCKSCPSRRHEDAEIFLQSEAW